MRQITLPGDPPIEVALRISRRARRLSLRVSRLDGRVSLTMPKGARIGAAQAFVTEREDWIRGHLDTTPAPIVLRPGGTVLFEGRPMPLVARGGRAARLEADVITLPLSAPEKTGARVAALFKQAARTRLTEASHRHAVALGREFSAITLRDTRSRWGSCSPEGRLMYSWRLVMAPPAVLEYVAAHEVAHLAEMNHSQAFWNQVERLMPDYHTHRLWLRRHGARLHAYRFRE